MIENELTNEVLNNHEFNKWRQIIKKLNERYIARYREFDKKFLS